MFVCRNAKKEQKTAGGGLLPTDKHASFHSVTKANTVLKLMRFR